MKYLGIIILVLGLLLTTSFAQPANPDAIQSLVWDASGTHYATGHKDGTVRIWDIQDLSKPLVLVGHTEAVISLAWSNTAPVLLSGSYDMSVKVWNTATGDLIATLDDAAGPTESVVYTPDGSKILAFTGNIRSSVGLPVWDSQTYSLLETKANSGLAASDVAWNDDLTMLAGVSFSGIIKIYDPVTYDPDFFIASMGADSIIDGLYSLDWHPNNQWLATGGFDGWVRIWDVMAQEMIFEAKGTDNPIIEWNTSAIRWVFFDESGSYLSSLSTDGILRTWDIATTQLVYEEVLPSSLIYAAVLNPDETILAYGGESGEVTIILLEDILTD